MRKHPEIWWLAGILSMILGSTFPEAMDCDFYFLCDAVGKAMLFTGTMLHVTTPKHRFIWETFFGLAMGNLADEINGLIDPSYDPSKVNLIEYIIAICTTIITYLIYRRRKRLWETEFKL